MSRPAPSSCCSSPCSSSPTKPTSGWADLRITVAAAIANVLTAPGQTPTMSVFVDPVVTGLGISRTEVSTAYLIGTLAGASALRLVGRLMDRRGVRAVLLLIGAVFGAVLVGLSTVHGLLGLTAGFVGVRFAGQGALTLISTTMVAYYIRERLGTVIGIVTAVGSAGISLAPLGLQGLIAQHGFRAAWLVQGIAVWVLIIPVAVFGVPRRRRDGEATHHRGCAPRGASTARRVLREPMFWMLAGGVGVLSLVGTALTFHQVDVLGERGLTPAQAAATFLPQTVAGLLATLLIGMLLDRVSPRVVMVASMLVLAGALVAGGYLEPGWSAFGYGIALGAAGNSFRTVEAATVPRYFGTGGIGEIRGIVHTFAVVGSAVGPVLLAVGHSALGSYRPLLWLLTVPPIGLIVGVVLVREPAAAPSAPAPAQLAATDIATTDITTAEITTLEVDKEDAHRMAEKAARPIRLGLIGIGLAVEQLHWPALAQLTDRFTVTAFADIDAAAGNRFAGYSGVAMSEFTTDYQELLRRDDVEAVLISVPIPDLYPVARDALRAGKHVLCEKPTGVDEEQAREFLALAERYPELTVLIAENFFYRDDLRLARLLLDDGAIGKPHLMTWRVAYQSVPREGSFTSTLWRRRPRYRGGAHLDAGVHHIAQIRLLCGEVARAHGWIQWANSTVDAPSDLTLNLTFANGTIGNYTAAYTEIPLPGEPNEMRLYGTEGVLILRGTPAERQVIVSDADGTTRTNVFRGIDNGYYGELCNFHEAVRHGEAVVGTVRQSFANMLVVLRALDSADRDAVLPVEPVGLVPLWRPRAATGLFDGLPGERDLAAAL